MDELTLGSEAWSVFGVWFLVLLCKISDDGCMSSSFQAFNLSRLEIDLFRESRTVILPDLPAPLGLSFFRKSLQLESILACPRRSIAFASPLLLRIFQWRVCLRFIIG
jgi:hypothetical protein